DYAGHRRFLELDNGASAGWRHTFGEGHELSADLVYNDDLARNHLLETTTPILNVAPRPLELIHDDASEHHGEVRLAYTQKVWGGSLKVGYELRHEDNEYNYADFQGPTLDALVRVPGLDNRFVFHQSANALYATWQRGFGDLDVQAGLRAEDVRWDLAQLTSGERDNQHYERAYPSLHLGYKLDDDRKLSASYSVRVQRPPVVFLNPLIYIEGPTEAQVGNASLKVKEVQIYDVGYTQRIGDQNLQADVYFRNAHHDFSVVMTDIGGGRFLGTYGNLGTSQAAGVDFTANGKLTSTLSYNLTISPYWYRLSGTGNTGAVIGNRSLTSSTERGTLTWQATKNDSLQLNLVVNGAHIQPQGEIRQGALLNAGWRHKIDDRTSLTLTGQDLTASDRFQRDLESPVLMEHLMVRPVSRQVILRLDYRFGGGGAKAAKDPGFEYENGGATPGPGGR
ncbi:MAG: TonB-dependent receptor family protein, partial [Proteobacteria bacterium]|nr:TonB-dependent receptor family protein [Pseudomonadota bacterium]